MTARFTLAAWVGAAMLFVKNGVRMVTAGRFDATTRDQLVLLRFPDYYAFGFTLVGIAFVTSLVAIPCFSRKRTTLYISLIAAALVLMLVDYLWVYRPLEAMLTPPGQARGEGFTALHERSMTINIMHVGLSLIAALTLCRPSAACRREP